jgi:hypothetical protein
MSTISTATGSLHTSAAASAPPSTTIRAGGNGDADLAGEDLGIADAGLGALPGREADRGGPCRRRGGERQDAGDQGGTLLPAR